MWLREPFGTILTWRANRLRNFEKRSLQLFKSKLFKSCSTLWDMANGGSFWRPILQRQRADYMNIAEENFHHPKSTRSYPLSSGQSSQERENDAVEACPSNSCRFWVFCGLSDVFRAISFLILKRYSPCHYSMDAAFVWGSGFRSTSFSRVRSQGTNTKAANSFLGSVFLSRPRVESILHVQLRQHFYRHGKNISKGY